MSRSIGQMNHNISLQLVFLSFSRSDPSSFHFVGMGWIGLYVTPKSSDLSLFSSSVI